MGFIPRILVEHHVSSSGKVMLKYPFKNKRGESDVMFIEIPFGYELVKKPMTEQDTKTMNEELERLESNSDLKKIWGVK